MVDFLAGLKDLGIACSIVTGGGTGSFYFEGASGVFNELQCGSYAFMDADYGRVLDIDGDRLDQKEWENALFILTSVMSHVRSDTAIVDAGLKVQSVDSGLPRIFGRNDVEYVIYESLLNELKFRALYRKRNATQSKEYIINPLGLVSSDARHYLICTFDHDRDTVRHLPLHRFTKADSLDEDSCMPEDYNLDKFITSNRFCLKHRIKRCHFINVDAWQI